MTMWFLLVLAFVVLVGPLAYFYGADSRDLDERGWFASPHR
jgi:hypothetical protein